MLALTGVTVNSTFPELIAELSVPSDTSVIMVPYTVMYVSVPLWTTITSVTWYDVPNDIDIRYLAALYADAAKESTTESGDDIVELAELIAASDSASFPGMFIALIDVPIFITVSAEPVPILIVCAGDANVPKFIVLAVEHPKFNVVAWSTEEMPTKLVLSVVRKVMADTGCWSAESLPDNDP